MEFKWVEKAARRVNGHGKDVSIFLGEKGKAYFTFRNKSYEKIGGDYFVFAVTRHRIYFKTSDSWHGYKFGNPSDPQRNTRYAGMKAYGITDELKGCEGNYDLHFDRVQNLYYVDLDEVEES